MSETELQGQPVGIHEDLEAGKKYTVLYRMEDDKFIGQPDWDQAFREFANAFENAVNDFNIERYQLQRLSERLIRVDFETVEEVAQHSDVELRQVSVTGVLVGLTIGMITTAILGYMTIESVRLTATRSVEKDRPLDFSGLLELDLKPIILIMLLIGGGYYWLQQNGAD